MVTQEQRERWQQRLTDPAFKPEYNSWRHGGWYVWNLHYASGACGCVSRNYPDKKWRIVCDDRPNAHALYTYRTRDEAAHAERELALASYSA
jgi:hypothetical protein